MAADSCDRCRFGQWYAGEDVEPLRDHPGFVALDEAHLEYGLGQEFLFAPPLQVSAVDALLAGDAVDSEVRGSLPG